MRGPVNNKSGTPRPDTDHMQEGGRFREVECLGLQVSETQDSAGSNSKETQISLTKESSCSCLQGGLHHQLHDVSTDLDFPIPPLYCPSY